MDFQIETVLGVGRYREEDCSGTKYNCLSHFTRKKGAVEKGGDGGWNESKLQDFQL